MAKDIRSVIEKLYPQTRLFKGVDNNEKDYTFRVVIIFILMVGVMLGNF